MIRTPIISRDPIIIPQQYSFDNYVGYIYITTNLKNGKQYLGKHISFEFDEKYLGSGVIITRAIQKYGRKSFICKPIDWAISEEQLSQKEIWWVEYLQILESDSWYNIASGGEGGNTHNYRRGINHPFYGVPLIDESRSSNRISLSNSLKGVPKSKESIGKMIRNLPDRSGKNNPNYGNGDKMKGKNNPMYGTKGQHKNKAKWKILLEQLQSNQKESR